MGGYVAVYCETQDEKEQFVEYEKEHDAISSGYHAAKMAKQDNMSSTFRHYGLLNNKPYGWYVKDKRMMRRFGVSEEVRFADVPEFSNHFNSAIEFSENDFVSFLRDG